MPPAMAIVVAWAVVIVIVMMPAMATTSVVTTQQHVKKSHRQSPLQNPEPAGARSFRTVFLLAQQAQSVENDQQAAPHVGEHGHPQGGMPAQGQAKEDDLDAQRQGDVLFQD